MALTKTQRVKASRMWANGYTMREIADIVCVTFNEVKSEIERHRDLYPRKYRERKCSR